MPRLQWLELVCFAQRLEFWMGNYGYGSCFLWLMCVFAFISRSKSTSSVTYWLELPSLKMIFKNLVVAAKLLLQWKKVCVFIRFLCYTKKTYICWFKGRFILLCIANILNYGIFALGFYSYYTGDTDFGTFLLAILMANAVLHAIFYISMKARRQKLAKM